MRVFVTFHFSKCRCYLRGLARLIFRRACSFAISENNRSHKKTASLTFSTPSITDQGTWLRSFTNSILLSFLNDRCSNFLGGSFGAPPFTTQTTKLWSLSVVWMMPDWTILCSLFVKSRSIRIFEYSVILVSSFMSCFMSFSLANDFGNLLAERFPSWSMFESPISTEPFFSRSVFAKESLRESIKLAVFTFRGLYVAACKQKRFALWPVNFNP